MPRSSPKPIEPRLLHRGKGEDALTVNFTVKLTQAQRDKLNTAATEAGPNVKAGDIVRTLIDRHL
ncbi:hypothetical protein KE423_003919 [Salmonella enterica]|nr:hypothetical protein [Salmonella enterica]